MFRSENLKDARCVSAALWKQPQSETHNVYVHGSVLWFKKRRKFVTKFLTPKSVSQQIFEVGYPVAESTFIFDQWPVLNFVSIFICGGHWCTGPARGSVEPWARSWKVPPSLKHTHTHDLTLKQNLSQQSPTLGLGTVKNFTIQFHSIFWVRIRFNIISIQYWPIFFNIDSVICVDDKDTQIILNSTFWYLLHNNVCITCISLEQTSPKRILPFHYSLINKEKNRAVCSKVLTKQLALRSCLLGGEIKLHESINGL